MNEYKRVCLPIFAQDILESMNELDINSSASKSLKSFGMITSQHKTNTNNVIVETEM